MTAEYLETSSRNLSNEVVFGSRSNSVPLSYLRRYSFAISKIIEKSLCCIKVRYSRGPDMARVRDRRVKYRYIEVTRYTGTNRENWLQKKEHRTDTVVLSTRRSSVVYAAP